MFKPLLIVLLFFYLVPTRAQDNFPPVLLPEPFLQNVSVLEWQAQIVFDENNFYFYYFDPISRTWRSHHYTPDVFLKNARRLPNGEFLLWSEDYVLSRSYNPTTNQLGLARKEDYPCDISPFDSRFYESTWHFIESASYYALCNLETSFVDSNIGIPTDDCILSQTPALSPDEHYLLYSSCESMGLFGASARHVVLYDIENQVHQRLGITDFLQYGNFIWLDNDRAIFVSRLDALLMQTAELPIGILVYLIDVNAASPLSLLLELPTRKISFFDHPARLMWLEIGDSETLSLRSYDLASGEFANLATITCPEPLCTITHANEEYIIIEGFTYSGHGATSLQILDSQTLELLYSGEVYRWCPIEAGFLVYIESDRHNLGTLAMLDLAQFNLRPLIEESILTGNFGCWDISSSGRYVIVHEFIPNQSPTNDYLYDLVEQRPIQVLKSNLQGINISYTWAEDDTLWLTVSVDDLSQTWRVRINEE